MSRKAALVGLLALVAMAGPALAGTTQNITITVTVEFLSVNVSPTTVALGTVAAGATSVGTKLDVTNDGNVAENIGLRIQDEDDLNAWTSAAAPGANVYVLFGIIVSDAGAAPLVGDYGANDVLTTTVKYWQGTGAAAGSQLVTDVGTATAVAAGAAKDLYFGFTAPSSVTGGTAGLQHSITAELSVYKD
jgi:hypothetical protein